MTEEQVIAEVWKRFQSVFGNKRYRLFLFGSRSTGKATPYSDFDFIIFGKKAVSHALLLRLKSDIKSIKTLFSIDIVDFNRATPDFQSIAKKTMKEVFGGKVRSQ